MFFIKIKSIFIDWFHINKLFFYDYYFDVEKVKSVKNKMYDNLLWYNKSMKFWCSFDGLYHLLYYINSSEIPFDNKYGVQRYYNDDNSRLQTDKTKSNAYLWNYLPLVEKSKANWSNDVLIQNEKEFLKKYSDEILNMYNKHIDKMKLHPENSTSLSNGEWSRIRIYDNKGWNKDLNDEIVKKIESTFRLAYNYGMIFFSKTSPNTKINGHYGSSNLRIRIHYGIEVPDKENTIMSVSEEKLFWENKTTIAFDDSFYHSSENNSKYDRVILIIDIFNPYLSDDECLFLQNDILKNLGKIK